jgi:type IV secretory pathway VirB10-like protein
MRMSQAAVSCVVLGVVVAMSGCGAQADRAPASAPSVVAEPPADRSPEESPATMAPVAPAPPPPPAALSVAAPKSETAGRGGSGSDLGNARSELALAEKQLQSSAGDCSTACRALGSMERATAHLCALASSSDDQRSCQDAKGKVLAGRDRVRASCGDCPGGPSLDKGAPIPSTR